MNTSKKRKYDVEYTSVHIWELLKALGFTLQRPRPRHHKAPDAEELERFKKKLPGWLKGQICEYRDWFNHSRFHRGVKEFPADLY